MISMSKAGNID